MSHLQKKVCAECGQKRRGCRASYVDQDGEIDWVCRECWELYDYDRYLYEDRLKAEKNQ